MKPTFASEITLILNRVKGKEMYFINCKNRPINKLNWKIYRFNDSIDVSLDALLLEEPVDLVRVFVAAVGRKVLRHALLAQAQRVLFVGQRPEKK